MYYINERLVNLHRIFDQNKREGYLRLDLNENPEGLSQEFIDGVLSGVTPEMVPSTRRLLSLPNSSLEDLVRTSSICRLLTGLPKAFATSLRPSLHLTARSFVYRLLMQCSRSTRRCMDVILCRFLIG